MYRVLSRMNDFNIYCTDDECDLSSCGLFHKPECETPIKSLRERRTKFRVQSLDLGPTEQSENKPAFFSTTSEGGRTGFLGIEPNAIEPITPLTVSGASTVTLEDIIASAKRKISQEFPELRIPSPIMKEGEEATDRRAAPDGTWLESDHSPAESEIADLSFVQHLVDSDDEEWHVFEDPPSIVEQGEQEDFDELLKTTRPPPDHYSNPLYREADPLSKRRRKKAKEDDSSSIELSVADMPLLNFDLDPPIALLHARLNDRHEERGEYEGNL
ncbi:hypothetical protein M3Y99_00042700 [Aphelenchoides fujianensis]|nr:hypothetical protein M3Y99_00042700 [Aphelenchoides fujianensis]